MFNSWIKAIKQGLNIDEEDDTAKENNNPDRSSEVATGRPMEEEEFKSTSLHYETS